MTTIIDILKTRAEVFPNHKLFFNTPIRSDGYFTLSDIYQHAQSLALGLSASGLKPGDTVGILGPSIPQWEIAQLGIWIAGGIVVGLDLNDTPKAHKHIIETCQIKYLFISDKSQGEALKSVLDDLSTIQFISLGASWESQPPAVGWAELAQPYRNQSWTGAWPKADSSATIVFTSGTTGEPKGIQYRHDQLVYAIKRLGKVFPKLKKGSRIICWMPLASLFQRELNWCALDVTGEIFFVANPRDVADQMPQIAPDIFASVPRFYEKVYAQIQEKVSHSSWVSQSIFHLALRVGRRYSQLQRVHQKPSWTLQSLHALCDRLVFKKIRDVFGSRIQFLLSGSAPLRLDILEFCHSIGLLILEAYGTSENIVPNACNRPDDYKFGSVGRPLIEGSIRISEEGEVCVQGYGIFEGYYKDPSKEMFDQGYYKTGDLGRFDEEGFLYLTGRKSQVFKTSTGLKIPTQAIQDVLQQVLGIDRVVTLGEFRKFPVALVSLDNPTENPLNSNVRDRIESDLRKSLLKIPAKYRPVGVLVLPRQLTVQDQEITPTLKVRRQFVEEKYSRVLDRFYQALEIHSSGDAQIWVLDPTNIHATIERATNQ